MFLRHALLVEAGPAQYTDSPAVSLVLVPAVSNIAAENDAPTVSFRLLPSASVGYADFPSVSVILSPSALSGRMQNEGPNASFVVAPAAVAKMAMNSAPGLSVVLAPTAVSQFNVGGVNLVQAVWNESAQVFLNPELLSAVWTAEAVVIDNAFGFPGIRNRIQTVRSRVTIQ